MLERGKELLVQIRSMRVQLFAVLVVIGLIPVIFFSNILINSYEKRLISQRTDEIQSYGTVLSNLVNSSEYLTGQEAPEVEQEAESIATIYQGRVLIINQDLSVVTDTFNLEVGKTMISSEVVRCFVDHEKRYVNDLGDYVQLTMPIVNASTEQTTGAIILTFFHQEFSYNCKCDQPTQHYFDINNRNCYHVSCVWLLGFDHQTITACYRIY